MPPIGEDDDLFDDPAPARIPKPSSKIVFQPAGAQWSLSRLPEVETAYQSAFKKRLPLVNKGQGSIHNKWGYDHRDSADVSINPSTPEGQQFTEQLKKMNVPFLAFTGAIPGVATGPHVHIGFPSHRTTQKFNVGAQKKSKGIASEDLFDSGDAVSDADLFDSPEPVQSQKKVNPFARVKAGIAAAPPTIEAGEGYSEPSRVGQKPASLARIATALPGVQQILKLLPEEEQENIVEGATGAIAGTIKQLANAQELGLKYTPYGIVGKKALQTVGVDANQIPETLKRGERALQESIAENETMRPEPTTFAGKVRRGVGQGVGAAVIEIPKLITGARYLGAANLPVQGALSQADEGVPGIIKGAATGLVYHYGGGLTGKYLGRVGNTLVWIGAPTAEQTLIQGKPLAQSLGESIPMGAFAGVAGAERVKIKTPRGERAATVDDLNSITSKKVEVVPPERVEDAREATKESSLLHQETGQANVQSVEPVETVRGDVQPSQVSKSAEPQRFQHVDFGEVEVSPDQTGARTGKVKVFEVSDPEKIHYVKRSDMQGRGNARMIPAKPTAEAAPAATTEMEDVPQRPLSPAPVSEGVEGKSAQTFYHGTPQSKPVEKFNIGRSFEKAIFLTDDPKLARRFAGEKGTVQEVDLSQVENPLTVDYSKEAGSPIYDAVTVERLIRRAKAEGHDGLVLRNIRDPKGADVNAIGTQFVVWDAEKAVPKIPSEPSKPLGEGVEKPVAVVSPVGDISGTSSESKGVGGALTPEPSGVPVKTAAIEAERAEAGLDPIEKQQYRNIGESYLSGKKAVEENRIDPRQLAAEVSKTERTLSGEEIGALGYDRARLRNEYDAKIAELNKAIDGKNDEAVASHRAQLQEIERLADLNDAALEKGGREQSIAFNARKMLVGRDYSLLGTLQRAKALKGAELTPQERGRIETLTKQLAEAEKVIAEYESKKGNRNIQRFISDAEREIRKQGRAAKKEVLDQEFAQLSQQFRAKMQGIQPAGIDPTLVPIIAKMARNRVQAGVNTVEGLVDTLHAELKDYIEDKRAIRDAFSGYGQEPKPRTKNEVTDELNRLRREARKLSKTEDFNPVTEAAKKEAAKQKAVKTRLTKQIAELENQLKTGNYEKAARPKLEYDKDAEQLLAHRDLLKDRIEREIAKQKKPLWEDYLTWWQQGTILSGTRTLAKLGSYALGKNVIIPIEDVISGGMSHVPGLRGLSKASPRYGGGIRENIAAQGAAFKEFVNKAMYRDAWTSLKEGTNALKLKHGDGKYQYSPRLLTFIRGLHMAEKVFASRPEYYRSIEKETQWAVRNGLDPENPKVQSQILSRAYMNGLRAQLMQPNIPSKILSTTNAWLESVGRTGKIGQIQEPGVAVAARAARTGVRALFPITRVPFNYVNEALSYNPVGGFAKGGVRIGAEVVKTLRAKGIGKGITELVQHGMSNMPPEAADATKRALIKGSMGIPFFLIGWYNYQNVGGYYQPGQRKEGDVPFGGFRIGNVEIPRALVHNPLFETMHFAATMRRVYEGEKDGGSYASAAEAAGKGLVEETPFVDVPRRIGTAVEGKEGLRHMAGEIARSATIPPDIQRIAAVTDTAEPTTAAQKALQVAGLKDVKAIKRSPHGFVQTYEMGVPGLRQRVPINEKAERTALKTSLTDQYRSGKISSDDLNALVQQGKLAKADQKAIEQSGKVSSFQDSFTKAFPATALDRYERMDESQRMTVKEIMGYKAFTLLNSEALTEAQKAGFRERIEKLGITPVDPRAKKNAFQNKFSKGFSNQFASPF